jgi:pimeloyl-ACP methyl ester carboxylesterase
MDLYFKESGPENSETIVFLHGGGLSGWMWEKQLESFTDYHCLVPDLPEHGKSQDIKPFTMENAADQVINLIEQKAHNRKTHVVGISLGAQIIVKMLSKSPEFIDHAVISGTLVRTLPATELILKLLNYTIKAYMPIKDSDFLIKSNIRSYGIPKDNFESLKEATRSLDADALNRMLHENMFFRIPEGLEKADNPVLVIAGEKEYGIMKKSASDLFKAFPNSEGYIASNMVHTWNLTSPEFFNNVVRSWITDKKLPDGLLALE